MGSHAGDLSQFSQEYIDYDQGPAVIGVSIAVGLLALASVGLRLWARHIKRVPLGIEDYLIIVCVVRIKNERRHHGDRDGSGKRSMAMLD